MEDEQAQGGDAVIDMGQGGVLATATHDQVSGRLDTLLITWFPSAYAHHYTHHLVLVVHHHPGQDQYYTSRADAMHTIESTIVELGGIFSQLAHMVKEQVGHSPDTPGSPVTSDSSDTPEFHLIHLIHLVHPIHLVHLIHVIHLTTLRRRRWWGE